MAPGGHLGFMQITGVAQSCQSGNQAEITRRGHMSTNQQKTSSEKTLLGSENFQSTMSSVGHFGRRL